MLYATAYIGVYYDRRDGEQLATSTISETKSGCLALMDEQEKQDIDGRCPFIGIALVRIQVPETVICEIAHGTDGKLYEVEE